MPAFLSETVRRQWADAVGPENVITDRASLNEVETGTFESGYGVPAIVRPGSR